MTSSTPPLGTTVRIKEINRGLVKFAYKTSRISTISDADEHKNITMPVNTIRREMSTEERDIHLKNTRDAKLVTTDQNQQSALDAGDIEEIKPKEKPGYIILKYTNKEAISVILSLIPSPAPVHATRSRPAKEGTTSKITMGTTRTRNRTANAAMIKPAASKKMTSSKNAASSKAAQSKIAVNPAALNAEGYLYHRKGVSKPPVYSKKKQKLIIHSKQSNFSDTNFTVDYLTQKLCQKHLIWIKCLIA